MLAIEYRQGVEDAWSDIATFVPKLVGFLLILLIGYFIVKAISKLVAAALERVGFDKVVERGGVKKALENSEYDASDILGKVIFYGLFLLVLQMAFGIFGDNPVSELLASVIAYLPKVVAAILILVIGAALAAVAKELIEAAMGEVEYAKTVASLVSAAILVIVAFAALNQLQIATDIVNGLFYAMLAIIVGSAVIAVGGGGIKPMQQRWEQSLQRYDEEKPRLRNQQGSAADRMKDQAQQRMGQAKQAAGSDQPSGSGSGRPPSSSGSGAVPAT